jgi:hypothetical protein
VCVNALFWLANPHQSVLHRSKSIAQQSRFGRQSVVCVHAAVWKPIWAGCWAMSVFVNDVGMSTWMLEWLVVHWWAYMGRYRGLCVHQPVRETKRGCWHVCRSLHWPLHTLWRDEQCQVVPHFMLNNSFYCSRLRGFYLMSIRAFKCYLPSHNVVIAIVNASTCVDEHELGASVQLCTSHTTLFTTTTRVGDVRCLLRSQLRSTLNIR